MKAFGFYRVNTTSAHNKTNKKNINTFHIHGVAITIQARGESCPLLKPYNIQKYIYTKTGNLLCILYVLILN